MNPDIVKRILKPARVGRWAIFRTKDGGVEYDMEGKITKVSSVSIELTCSACGKVTKTFDAKLGTAADGSRIIRIINR